jgi:hypothetical protein
MAEIGLGWEAPHGARGSTPPVFVLGLREKPTAQIGLLGPPCQGKITKTSAGEVRRFTRCGGATANPRRALDERDFNRNQAATERVNPEAESYEGHDTEEGRGRFLSEDDQRRRLSAVRHELGPADITSSPSSVCKDHRPPVKRRDPQRDKQGSWRLRVSGARVHQTIHRGGKGWITRVQNRNLHTEGAHPPYSLEVSGNLMAVPAFQPTSTESYQTVLNGSTWNTSARIAYKCVPAFPRLSASYGKAGSGVCFVLPLCYHPPAL